MAGYIDASRPPGLWSADYNPRHELLEAPRSIQVGWARRRRIDRAARREEAGRSRTVERLAKLGAAWRVLDIEDLGLPIRNTFLTIGPGGVFLVPAFDLTYLSSSLVREVARFGGDLSGLVHPSVQAALRKKLGR